MAPRTTTLPVLRWVTLRCVFINEMIAFWHIDVKRHFWHHLNLQPSGPEAGRAAIARGKRWLPVDLSVAGPRF